MTGKLAMELVRKAAEASANAYSPYSRFCVGAAVLTTDGKIFSGCNVENASYGLTVCAERIAIFNAVSSGSTRFRAIAIVAGGDTPPFPCGACRQVLSEFCDSSLPVYVANIPGPAVISRFTLGKLLPNTFKFKAGGRNAGAGKTSARKSL